MISDTHRRRLLLPTSLDPTFLNDVFWGTLSLENPSKALCFPKGLCWHCQMP